MTPRLGGRVRDLRGASILKQRRSLLTATDCHDMGSPEKLVAGMTSNCPKLRNTRSDMIPLPLCGIGISESATSPAPYSTLRDGAPDTACRRCPGGSPAPEDAEMERQRSGGSSNKRAGTE